MNTRLSKLLLVALLIIVLAGATNAFAATNTVSTSYAGDGAATISGYNVTNVHYTLNNANPRNLASVSFTLSQPASDVRVKLVSSGTTFDTCTNTAGNDWTCTLTGTVTALQADELTVIAVQ